MTTVRAHGDVGIGAVEMEAVEIGAVGIGGIGGIGGIAATGGLRNRARGDTSVELNGP